MTVKESYAILGIKQGADLTAVKQAYRRSAFELHPDLHPEVRDAARRFQRLNEAYVLLTQHLESVRSGTRGGKATGAEATEKARQEARRAYAKAKADEKPSERTVYKEEVLHDILKDPFARRVFEDIYRHVRKEEENKASSAKSAPKAPPRSEPAGKSEKAASAPISQQAVRQAGKMKKTTVQPASPGVVDKLKGWLRKQIDDQQELKLPGASLKPGAVVRLDIQHGITGKTQTVELVLPPGFKPGKTLRLKGMGRQLGNLSGDLYVRITAL